jgi:hypothetical protein
MAAGEEYQDEKQNSFVLLCAHFVIHRGELMTAMVHKDGYEGAQRIF